MIKTREAIPSDAKKYLAFLHKLDSQTSFMLLEPGERTTTEEEMKSRIEDTIKSSLLLIVEDNGEIVGFLTASRGHVNRIRHSAYIVTGLLKEYQGIGLGKELFRRLNEWATKNGLARLELTVMVHNDAAVNLYSKMGFKIEGLKEKSCFVNGEFVDEYYMAKIY